MNNIVFGQYYPAKSMVHDFDPRLKIVGLFILLITIFVDAGFFGYFVLFSFLLALYHAAKLPFIRLFKAIRTIILMMLLLSIFNILLIKEGNLLTTIGPISIYSKAVFQSIYIIIRLVLIIMITTILTSTTKPLDMTLGLEYIMKPLRKIGFPTYEVAMMISIALRFIPTLLEETKRIMMAQASRGVDFEEGTFKEKITAIISLIIPLFISSFQKADDLANAMESRNYQPSRPRTRYHALEWKIYDTAGLVTVLSLFIIMFYWSLIL